MKLSIHGKQLDIGASLRAHIERGVSGIVGKYFDNPTDATVTVTKEGQSFRTDITVHVGKGIMVQGHAQSGDPYASFETAGEHVAKRLRRYKRRLRDHHRGRGAKDETLTAAQYVLAAESDIPDQDDAAGEPDQPIVIAEMETPIETMTVGEAVMRMDLAGLPAMLFRNRAHGGFNMVYLREDGNVGWVDPKNHSGEESQTAANQE
jgi:ribosomal subunit interface protein